MKDLKFYADVFVWSPDGTVKRMSPGDGIYYQACIHPAGTHVVFSGSAGGVIRIWQTAIATGDMQALTPVDWGARHPVYSWDGNTIVFASDKDTGAAPESIEHLDGGGAPQRGRAVDLFTMDTAGGNIRRITKGPACDQRPCFHPDGTHIAFVSNRTYGQPGIWVTTADGGSEPESVTGGTWSYRPWYSRDGSTIYFFSGVNERHQICAVDPRSRRIAPLSNDDKGRSHGPFADPQKDLLLMHSTRSGTWQIWELPLDGGEPVLCQPPGFDKATHATRARNGAIAFDAVRGHKIGPSVS